MKRLLQKLSLARGNGSTSMISLVIPPGDQINRVAKMLAEESGAAANIKSRSVTFFQKRNQLLFH